MKKLMIAAAAAAMVGGASAELCTETLVADGCAVYNVKFSLKTLAAKKKACDARWLAQTVNGWVNELTVGAAEFDVSRIYSGNIAARTADDFTAAAAVGTDMPGAAYPQRLSIRDLYWMDNATRKWEGILWQCRDNCFDGVGADRLNFVLWEAKSERAISYPAFRVWNRDQASYTWFSVSDGVSPFALTRGWASENGNFWYMGRYGQKATKIAIGWNPTIDVAPAAALNDNIGQNSFHCAGFGNFDAKNERMTSVSGNCVGLIAPLIAGQEDECGGDTEIFVLMAPVCQDFRGWCCDDCYFGEEWVPASGTWQIKYNKSLSTGKKPLSSIIPEYAVWSNADPRFANVRAGVATVLNSDAAPVNCSMDNDGIVNVNAAPSRNAYLERTAAEVGAVEAELDRVAKEIRARLM